jgi:hypothetical protein
MAAVPQGDACRREKRSAAHAVKMGHVGDERAVRVEAAQCRVGPDQGGAAAESAGGGISRVTEVVHIFELGLARDRDVGAVKNRDRHFLVDLSLGALCRQPQESEVVLRVVLVEVGSARVDRASDRRRKRLETALGREARVGAVTAVDAQRHARRREKVGHPAGLPVQGAEVVGGQHHNGGAHQHAGRKAVIGHQLRPRLGFATSLDRGALRRNLSCLLCSDRVTIRKVRY